MGKSTREIIQGLFEQNPKAAAAHRLTICCHATKCRQLCENLIKAPGKADVRCVNLKTKATVMLYEAITHCDWHCPRSLF